MAHSPDSSQDISVRIIDIANIKPAPYNPRKIGADKIAQLQDSIKFVGFGKPIILNTDGTIIAGHQRTKAAKAIGLLQVPAYVMTNVSEEDEVRFNQIHNSADIDSNIEVYVPPYTGEGFVTVGASDIHYPELPRGANARSMIQTLFLRHGQFSACIASQDGEVLSGQQYAVSMHALNKPLLVYYLHQGKKDIAKAFLTDQYGEFSYDHLKKNTYIQSFAQKFRLRSESHSKSALYEHFVLRALQPEHKAFDFGCGQADYLKMLRGKGYDVDGIEFYYRSGNSIDVAAIDIMAANLFANIVKRRNDIVICDSVLNSVDSLDAESDVVNVCNGLLRKGGTLFISGRRTEFIKGHDRVKKQKNLKERYIEFLDEHGFSALYRNGEWFYQKFHTKDMARKLIESKGFEIIHHEESVGASSWQIVAKKIEEIPHDELIKSVEREFSLPLPGNQRHQYAPQAIQTFKNVYEQATNNPEF